MTFKYFLPLLLLLACSKTPKHDTDISRVVLARGGCYGTCPVDIIAIDSSLNCYYQDMRIDDYKGLSTGRITRGLWDSITTNLENIRFKELDSNYTDSYDDEALAVKVFYGGKLKYVRAHSSQLPKEVNNVFQWIGKTSQKIKLKQAESIDGFDFSISVHGPLAAPKTIIRETEKTNQ